jgi:hypothetical protein
LTGRCYEAEPVKYHGRIGLLITAGVADAIFFEHIGRAVVVETGGVLGRTDARLLDAQVVKATAHERAELAADGFVLPAVRP